MKTRLMMFVAVFVLVAISVKGAVVDTLDVYSEDEEECPGRCRFSG